MKKTFMILFIILTFALCQGCVSYAENTEDELAGLTSEPMMTSGSFSHETTQDPLTPITSHLPTQDESVTRPTYHYYRGYSVNRDKGISYEYPAVWEENNQLNPDYINSEITYFETIDSEYQYRMFYQYQRTHSDNNLAERLINTFKSSDSLNFLEQLPDETYEDITFLVFRNRRDYYGTEITYVTYQNQNVYFFSFSESINEEIRNRILTSIELSDYQAYESTTPTQKDSMTNGQANALNAALDYLKVSPYSEKVLREKLRSDGHREEDIDFVMKHQSINFDEIAIRAAWQALDNGENLVDVPYTLGAAGFTDGQAEYALEYVYYYYGADEDDDDSIDEYW